MILSNSKRKAAENPYSFQDRFRDIQRIAIIYPEQPKWVRIAQYTLQKLYNLPEHFEFLIMRPAGLTPETVNAHLEYAEMMYAPTKMDRPLLIGRIMEFRPEMLLQLEPDPDERLIKLLTELQVGLKVGFGPEDSGLNIVYSQNKTGFYEKNILNLIALLEK